jgi:hypothetical protein
MTQQAIRADGGAGMTVIGPIPGDPQGFHQRLLLSGLRFAPVPVRTALYSLPTGMVIAAFDERCTGYLFATDGFEAPESDLYRFLSAELRDGEGVSISGEYAPDPDRTIRSEAHFRFVGGRLMCAEERVLLGPNGQRELLRSRTDLAFANVVPIRPRLPDLGFEP